MQIEQITNNQYDENVLLHPEKLIEKAEQEISFKGIVFKVKENKSFAFVQIMYDKAIIQCIYNDLSKPVKEGYAVAVKGIVKPAQIKDIFILPNNCEIHITSIEVLNAPSELLPFDITKKEFNVNTDTKFDFRMIALRNPKERAIFKVQEALVYGLREFFKANAFTEIRTPKIVKEGAEGGANLFEIKYFDRSAYLTQSPQFYKEFGTGIFGKVFEIASVFRAEKHNTSRHLNEYVSIDFEAAFINSYTDVMSYITGLLASAFNYVQANCQYELNMWNAQIEAPKNIPAIRFPEAKTLLREKYKLNEIDDKDFSPIEETTLCEHAKKELGSEFLFVTHYPSEKRPFYAKDDPENPGYTLSFDLLYRGSEIVTGGQRINNLDEINAKFVSRGMDPKAFEFFTIAHKYGLPPHGGMGMGLERLTQKVLGLENVKFASMYPRDIIRITP